MRSKEVEEPAKYNDLSETGQEEDQCSEMCLGNQWKQEKGLKVIKSEP